MKKYFLVATAIAFLSFNNRLVAQDSNEANTLFAEGTSLSAENPGFFLAPAYGMSSMDGSVASLFNLRGGLSLKDKISFGGYFSTSLNPILPESETVQAVYMDYWTLGGFVEYTLSSKKAFHLTFPLYIGYGEVEMDNEIGDAGLGEANFFQIEPSALLEVNLHQNFRLNLGAGYRFVGQMDYRNLNQSDMSGLTASVGLKFGLFR